jgi:hypothetical protein
MAAPKPNGGFRIVHQLHPLDSIVYTALAAHVAESVENNRLPKSLDMACSYRIDTSKIGDFFNSENGYDKFLEKQNELSHKCSYVLVADLTDFYNQIYLHPLASTLAFCNDKFHKLSSEIENFLMQLNTKISKGIPVGPAASIILSEALLSDIDKFITEECCHDRYTRYVDDLRIFSSDQTELTSFLEKLTLYLYKCHRLTLSSAKTKIIPTKEFQNTFLTNPELETKQKIHQHIDQIISDWNPYADESEAEYPEKIDFETETKVMPQILKEIVDLGTLDLGLARHILRRCQRRKIRSITPVLLDNFDFFSPVIRDVVLYLKRVSNTLFIAKYIDQLSDIISSSSSINYPYVKYWFEYLCAHFSKLQEDNIIHSFLFKHGTIPNQAIAAVIKKDISWVHGKKTILNEFGMWDRRAIIFASTILPKSERSPWLKHIELTVKEKNEEILIRWAKGQ